MKLNSKSGATLAAAAATLFLAGAVVSTGVDARRTPPRASAWPATPARARAPARAASNSCKGQNACKGQGFSAASEKQCAAMGAKFVKG